MAKAKLIFDLNDSEDLFQFKLTNEVNAMYGALFEIKNNLKRKFKYNDNIDWNTADLIFRELDEITIEIDLYKFS